MERSDIGCWWLFFVSMVVIPSAVTGSCTVDTCTKVDSYKDIKNELYQLKADIDTICEELMDIYICNKLRLDLDSKMKVHDVAQKYFESHPMIFWEDFIEIVNNNFHNARHALEIKEAYITGACSADGCPSTVVELPKKQREKATVLLIGSTGNGKSALGNFLLNPFDEQRLSDPEKRYFKTSTDLQPHTNETKAVWENVSYSSFYHSVNLTVVDTPGLNDVKDDKNMFYLMKKLQDIKEINTCILVVKFDGKIDVQYNETLEYYSELLPHLFLKNLIVVVTHYFQDEASITRRKRGNIDEEVIKHNILDAVRTTCGLPANPMLFMIDSLPAKGDNTSLSVRNEILDYVFKQEPYTIPQFKVAKTKSMKQRDKTMYDKLMQEATEQSRQTYSNNPDLQKELDMMDDAIADLKADKKQWEMKRDNLNTEELVEGRSWKTKKRWKLFETPSDKYHLSTCPYKIRNIIKDGSEEVHWRREERTDCTLSGKVEGEKNHGYRASIILQVYKRDKYEKEIIDCKKEIEKMESRLTEKMKERASLKEAHELMFKDKSDKQIKEAREMYKKYSDDSMTLDEAIKRLEEN